MPARGIAPGWRTNNESKHCKCDTMAGRRTNALINYQSQMNRRDFLTTTAAGVSLSGWLGRLAAAAPGGKRPKSCILLWMAGGPSHIDTFDPKPDAPAEI